MTQSLLGARGPEESLAAAAELARIKAHFQRCVTGCGAAATSSSAPHVALQPVYTSTVSDAARLNVASARGERTRLEGAAAAAAADGESDAAQGCSRPSAHCGVSSSLIDKLFGV